MGLGVSLDDGHVSAFIFLYYSIAPFAKRECVIIYFKGFFIDLTHGHIRFVEQVTFVLLLDTVQL